MCVCVCVCMERNGMETFVGSLSPVVSCCLLFVRSFFDRGKICFLGGPERLAPNEMTNVFRSGAKLARNKESWSCNCGLRASLEQTFHQEVSLIVHSFQICTQHAYRTVAPLPNPWNDSKRNIILYNNYYLPIKIRVQRVSQSISQVVCWVETKVPCYIYFYK